MGLPHTLANGPGNEPDATQLMDNFNMALLKDGSVSPTADLPMNSKKITGLADGAASGEAVHFGQLSNLANANVLINGGFEIWQRGTSFTNPASLAYTVDRWRTSSAGTLPTYSVSQESSIIDGSGVYAVKINITDNAGNTGLDLQQLIENYSTYAGKTVTFQARVRSTVTGAKLCIADGTQYVYSSALSVTGSYQTLTVTATISATPTWLGFILITGGTVGLQAPIGTWYMDNAMAVIGSQAVAYAPRPFAHDVQMCQRYFHKSYGLTTPPASVTDAGVIAQVVGTATTGPLYTTAHFPADMRVTPTITVYDHTTGASGQLYRGAGGKTAAVYYRSTMKATIGTDDATSANSIYLHYTADAEV